MPAGHQASVSRSGRTAVRPTGATRMMRIVIGRNAAPACTAREAEDVLHVERDEEEDAEHRERDEQDDEVGADVRPVAEQRQVEHRRALAALEHDERQPSATAATTKAPTIRARAPPVGVRLDQPVRRARTARPPRWRARAGRGAACVGSRDSSIRRKLATMPTIPTGHVDEEDPVPARVLGEETADERADRERERGDARPDADRGARAAAAGRSRR